MHKARLDRRELIKKTLAIGAAGYVGPKIVGTVATVNAQSISGSVCAISSCAAACQNTCACVATVNGPITCVEATCNFADPCNTSADCGQGFVCFTEGCCGGGNVCVPLCGLLDQRQPTVTGKRWH